MKIFALLALLLTSPAHASLFGQFEAAENARNEASAEKFRAEQGAYVEGVTRAWILQNLHLPANTPVTNEGHGRQDFGSGTNYNVGGVWGCVVFDPNGMSLGVSCLNASGQRHNFKRDAIDAAYNDYYCVRNPGTCKAAPKRRRR